MKRELKPRLSTARSTAGQDIAKPIPMKRELKRLYQRSTITSRAWNCKAYPDEKGIETGICSLRARGLCATLQSLSRWKGNWNHHSCQGCLAQCLCCIAKPIPMKRELKRQRLKSGRSSGRIAKPIPMKRELKLSPHRPGGREEELHCKAYPDKKGIETGETCSRPAWHKRLQSLSRWKGNWNGNRYGRIVDQGQELQSLSRWKGNWNRRCD